MPLAIAVRAGDRAARRRAEPGAYPTAADRGRRPSRRRGSDRDGQQVATLRIAATTEVTRPALARRRHPAALSRDRARRSSSRSTARSSAPPDGPYGDYLRRIGVAGTIRSRTLSVDGAVDGPGGRARATPARRRRRARGRDPGAGGGPRRRDRHRPARSGRPRPRRGLHDGRGEPRRRDLRLEHRDRRRRRSPRSPGGSARRRRAVVLSCAIVAYVAVRRRVAVGRPGGGDGRRRPPRPRDAAGRAGRRPRSAGRPRSSCSSNLRSSSMPGSSSRRWRRPGSSPGPTGSTGALADRRAADGCPAGSPSRSASRSPPRRRRCRSCSRRSAGSRSSRRSINLAIVPLVAPAMAAAVVALAGGALAVLGGPSIVATVAGLPAWALLTAMCTVVRAGAALPIASVDARAAMDGRRRGRRRRCVPAAWSSRRPAAIARAGRRATTVRQRACRADGAGCERREPASAGRRRGRVSRGCAGPRGRGRRARDRRPPIGPTARPGSRSSTSARATRSSSREAAAAGCSIDGGPDPDRLLVELDRRLPPWDRRIDVLVLTHPHEDHVAGLAAAPRALPRSAGSTRRGCAGRDPATARSPATSPADGAAATGSSRPAPGSPLDDIRFRVLWPDPGRVPREPPDGGRAINDVSIVLLGEVAGPALPADRRRRGRRRPDARRSAACRRSTS